MNVNYIYPEYYYPVYPEYFYGYYEPTKQRQPRRNAYTYQNQAINSDIDNSVKQIIQISKDQIAKEKEYSTDSKSTKIMTISNHMPKPHHSMNPIQIDNHNGLYDPQQLNDSCGGGFNNPNSQLKTDQNSPPIGETNRLAKHIVEILENIYQNSSFVNRKRREEIAIELNLPIEKVRNWFQNRRGKDRRLNHLHKISSRKYIRSGKYSRKNEEFNAYYEQKSCHYNADNQVDNGATDANIGLTNPLYIVGSNSLGTPTELVAPSPEPIRVSKDESVNEDIKPETAKLNIRSNTEPYWPSYEWDSIYNIPNVLVSSSHQDSDYVSDDEFEEISSLNYTSFLNTDYEVVVDDKTNKTYIVLNDAEHLMSYA